MDIFLRKYSTIFLLVLCVLLCPLRSESEAATAIESKVKVAFIVNFARFISWPEESFGGESEPLVICTVGLDSDETVFAGVESKKIKGHPIVLKNISSLNESTQSCHLLYIQNVNNKDLKDYLKSNEISPVVTIGESDGFASLGGTIQFVKINDRLSFKINNTQAKERQLRINASLLNLAVEVY